MCYFDRIVELTIIDLGVGVGIGPAMRVAGGKWWLNSRYSAGAGTHIPAGAPNSLQKAHFVESMLSCLPGQQGVAAMPMEPPEGRKVKSGPVGAVEATDRHERAKDYLSPAEMTRLLDAAKTWRGSAVQRD